ncbi:MAG: hypothetical protein WA667_11080 [Candidatus Nitrosopolaris sp.]
MSVIRTTLSFDNLTAISLKYRFWEEGSDQIILKRNTKDGRVALGEFNIPVLESGGIYSKVTDPKKIVTFVEELMFLKNLITMSPSLKYNLMAQINFRRLFGILFTTFILIFVFIFTIIALSGKLSFITASILIIVPLIIRYVVYLLTKI